MMNKFCTVLSVSLSVACFTYMFNSDLYISCAVGFIAFMLSMVGFSVENRAPYYWNAKLNKLLYYLSKDDREYNVDCKEQIYTRLSETEYKCEKVNIIRPTCNNLDRMQDRFSWSASSSGAKISAMDIQHEITAIRQQELWTYYSIYFHQIYEKRKAVRVGSIIHNLLDPDGQAVPFLSVTVDRKTKLLVMRVRFENDRHSESAMFKIFSSKIHPRKFTVRI